MDEENMTFLLHEEDGIIIEDNDNVILFISLITDSTDIIQNFNLSSTSAIALQAVNLEPEYTGHVTYQWCLSELTSDGEGVVHIQTIADTVGSDTSTAVIFSGLNPKSVYSANCIITYETGSGLYDTWTSRTIPCTLEETAPDTEPDFSNARIKYVTSNATSVIVRLNELDESYQTNYKIKWIWYNEAGKLIGVDLVKQKGGVTQSDKYRITGLDPSSSYIIDASIIYGDGDEYDNIRAYVVDTDPAESDGENVEVSFADTEITISVTDTTNTDLGVKITGLDTNYPGFWTLALYLYNADRELVAMNPDDIVIVGGYPNSDVYVFRELTPGATYYIRAVLLYNDDCEYSPPDVEWIMGVGGGEVTGSIPNMDSVHIAEQETDDPYTKLSFRLEELDTRYSEDDWDIDWYVYYNESLIGSFSDDLSPGNSESKTITISGLISNTTYKVSCRIRYYDLNGFLKTVWFYSTDDDSEGDFTTSAGSAGESGAEIIAESSADGTNITAYVSGLDTSYSRDGRWINWYLDGVYKGQTSGISAGVSSTENDPYLFKGLTPKTKYTIRAEIHFVNNGSNDTKDLYITVTTLGGRPEEFEWTYSKVKGKPFKLMAQEWCDLLDNINAVLEYKGKSKATTGNGLAQFTYPSPTDTFTALMYNQCLYQFIQLGLITEVEYGETYKVSSGDPVTADCLNLLVEMINSIE